MPSKARYDEFIEEIREDLDFILGNEKTLDLHEEIVYLEKKIRAWQDDPEGFADDWNPLPPYRREVGRG